MSSPYPCCEGWSRLSVIVIISLHFSDTIFVGDSNSLEFIVTVVVDFSVQVTSRASVIPETGTILLSTGSPEGHVLSPVAVVQVQDFFTLSFDIINAPFGDHSAEFSGHAHGCAKFVIVMDPLSTDLAVFPFSLGGEGHGVLFGVDLLFVISIK